MIIYNDQAAMYRAHQGVKKWNRTFIATETAEEMPLNQAQSVVDSLTYSRHKVRDLASPNFVGHRRYFEVIQPLSGAIEVEVAKKEDLEVVEEYSDLTDREWLAGEGELVTVEPGQFLMLDIDEAERIFPAPHSAVEPDVVIYRVTVEGASFHNK